MATAQEAVSGIKDRMRPITDRQAEIAMQRAPIALD